MSLQNIINKLKKLKTHKLKNSHTYMEIKSAEFTISSSRADMCPKSDIPEYAFIGRSQYADKEAEACHDLIYSG